MKIWIYVDGRQQGPFELEGLLDKPVTESTKVWFEGLPKWYPAGYLDELRPLFDGSLARKLNDDKNEESAPAAEGHVPDSIAEEEASPEDNILQAEERAGTEDNGATAVRQPAFSEAQPAQSIPDEPCPPTYLGWTIFLTICCCSPLSVASLVTAILTSSYYNSGNLRKARNCSEITAWLIMISLALGFFSFFLWDIFF